MKSRQNKQPLFFHISTQLSWLMNRGAGNHGKYQFSAEKVFDRGKNNLSFVKKYETVQILFIQ